MLQNATVRSEGVGVGRFEVTADKREALLLQWCKGYEKALTNNWKNHWYKFLRGTIIIDALFLLVSVAVCVTV